MLFIINGRLLDPASGKDATGHLQIDDGRITKISGQPLEISEFSQAQVIDATNCWVVPGLIDLHVHLREPGEEYKETVASGVTAAVAGGFTAIACMPNTKPANDHQGVTELILRQARNANLARVYPVGAISKGLKGEHLAEIGDLVAAGCRAISDDGHPVMSSALMRRALEYAKCFQVPVIAHEEDLSLAGKGVMNEGPMATRLGLPGIPSAAEESMVARDLSLLEVTGGRLHLAHLSCAGSVRLLRDAKKRGLSVTAEAAPHHFTLTEEAVADYNTYAKVNPPLRTPCDRQAIIDALADGAIDAIATDHAPHATMQKEVEFEAAANGLVGLETAVPLSLELVRIGMLSPLRMVELLSTGPAKVLNVSGGVMAEGSPADVTVIDPHCQWLCAPAELHSKSTNTPFLNRSLKGKAIYTVVGGRVVYSYR